MSFMVKNVVFTIISKESVKKKLLLKLYSFTDYPKMGNFKNPTGF